MVASREWECEGGNSRSINKRSENWTELGLLRLVPLCYVYQNVRQSIIAEEEWTKDLRLCGRLQSTCKLMRASGLLTFSRTYRSVGRIPSEASLNAMQTARAKFRVTCVTLEFTSFATKGTGKKLNVLKWDSLILYWTSSYDNHDSNHLHHDHDCYVRGKSSPFVTSCRWWLFCLRCFLFIIIQKDILKIWPLVTISIEIFDNVVVSCQTHCVYFKAHFS